MVHIDPLGLAIGLALALIFLVWDYYRSVAILRRWVFDNGYQLLHYERRYLRLGPFFFMTSRSQRVFYIEVNNQRGEYHTGYARCGSWWVGLLSDKVEVRWNE